MIEFILGAAVGAGAMIAKDTIGGNNELQKQAIYQKQQMDELFAENEKLRNRNRDAESRIEDLANELQKAKAQFKDKDNNAYELEDDLADAKLKIKKLTQQNDELLRRVQEYKQACESYENEIAQLKNR